MSYTKQEKLDVIKRRHQILLRQVELFKAHLDCGSYLIVAEKYGIYRTAPSKACDKLLDALAWFVSIYNRPDPVHTGAASRLENKTYWYALVDEYLRFSEVRVNLTVDSPVEYLSIAPGTASVLIELNIKTVGKLIDTLRTNKRSLIDTFGLNTAAVSGMEKALDEHGY